MREILFRGKNIDDHEWVYGYVVSVADISRATIYAPQDPKECDWATLPFLVDPDTVGQFTGLLDKNGNKIFEGDILKDKYMPEGKDIPKDKFNHIWLVTYERGAFCITNGRRSGTLFDPYAEDEIIGNQWDNPELLNP